MASNAKFGDYNLLPPNCKHQIGGQGNAPFKHFKHFKKFEKKNIKTTIHNKLKNF